MAKVDGGLLSNALGSHMVLQRGPARANLWGWTSSPGATVTVAFNGKTYTAKSDLKTSAWNVLLDATDAGGPYTIGVKASTGEAASLSDVLFGDVYVCGGQSNMQFTVHSAFNATEEIKAADMYPNIRLFTVGQGTFSADPLPEFKTIAQPWSVASAATVGVGDWNAFSAACWFFGRDLYDHYKVPLGLFSDNWGGTIVEAWSSPDALSKCNKLEEKQLQGEQNQVSDPNTPSELWNAMIVPILPMSITGATWYQGESNSNDPNHYACTFPAMINDWRLKWGGETDKEFNFFFVQLAPWLNNDLNAEALTRLSQMYATKLPNVGVATAMDWGDPTSPYNNIHPRYKQIVGERLHLVARSIAYKENVQSRGPEASDWKILTQSPNARVSIAFIPETLGTMLVSVPKQCDDGVPTNQCGWFDLGTSDGKWTNATGTIVGNTLEIYATLAAPVSGVRYAWGNFPVATIYNKEGLPALPFAFPNPITPNPPSVIV